MSHAPDLVSIRAEDRGGLVAVPTFTVDVANVNVAPRFASTPPTLATVGATMVYDAQVVDPDAGDVVSLALAAGPSGATLAGGRLSFVMPAGEPTTSFVLRATDLAGASVDQSFTITAGADTSAPQLTLTVTPQAVAPGDPVTIVAVATDDVGYILTAYINGDPVAIEPTGTATFSTGVPGAYRVQVTATDRATRDCCCWARMELGAGSGRPLEKFEISSATRSRL